MSLSARCQRVTMNSKEVGRDLQSGRAASRLGSMSVPTRIVVGVAGGYLLGRTKKLRLALALGGLLAGGKLASQGKGVQGLLGQGSKLLESNPQLKELQNQVTGHLVEAAREARLMTAASRIESLTKSLQARQQGSAEQGGEQQGGQAALESALGGVTGSLGLKGSGKGKGKAQDRSGEEES